MKSLASYLVAFLTLAGPASSLDLMLPDCTISQGSDYHVVSKVSDDMYSALVVVPDEPEYGIQNLVLVDCMHVMSIEIINDVRVTGKDWPEVLLRVQSIVDNNLNADFVGYAELLMDAGYPSTSHDFSATTCNCLEEVTR